MNKQIEEYIIDKSFEDVLQNDMPIINQEENNFYIMMIIIQINLIKW